MYKHNKNAFPVLPHFKLTVT